MKIWHAIWKGYNSDYEVYCFDRVVQGLKAAFTLHHKFFAFSQGNKNQEYLVTQVMGMTRQQGDPLLKYCLLYDQLQ